MGDENNRDVEKPFGGAGLSRRNFLKISGTGLAGAALLGVAGCGGGQEEGGEQGGETEPTNGTAPEQGGGNQVIIGLDQEPAILNDDIVGGDLVATSNVTVPVQEGVLQIMPDLTYAPLLADGDPEVVSEDPFTLEFRFREGLTWSDGEQITSEDWRFTYDTVMNPDNQIITREIWDKIDTVETPDDLTVRIIFSEPDARWRDMLAEDVLPQHVLEGEDFNTFFNEQVIGSGPFMFEEWRKGQNLTLVRNDNYWGEAPAIERVVYRFIPDTNSLISALQAGEVQFINPPPDVGLIERLEGISGVTVETAFGTVWEHLAFNLEEVDNLNIRRAVAYGVNRQQIIDELLRGNARPLQSVLVPENDAYYTPAWERYAYDPEQASQLVEQAQAEGASTDIRYSTTAGAQLREVAQQVIQQQMEEIGITLNIDNTSADTFFGEWTVQGNFSLGQWAWSASPDPAVTTLFSADQLPPDGQNYYRYQNEEVTQLMQQSDSTVDEAERAELLQQVQELMAEDCPLVPLYQRPEIYAFSESLSGPEVNPTLATAFWNIGEWSLSG